MAIVGNSRFFIEPDDQYTTITIARDDSVEGDTLVAIGQNQTLAAAFDKMKSDLATLVTGGKKARSGTINVRIE